MNQKGSLPIFLIIILVIAGLVLLIKSNKLTNIIKTSPQDSISNSEDFYKDFKTGLKKAFDK